jgi:asparagine synthase (glutamine-hydrolysing)
MCGIAGIVSIGSQERLHDLEARLSSMAACMHHRGPDDGGVYVSIGGRAGLANRRLAIRDLSTAGHMPMGNTEGTIHITYNGEIYNADELRVELERLGYSFHSGSDTEVILHGYAEWGEQVVERLRGMFAFGIWDCGPNVEGSGKLFLAKDRLGIKPLYYSQTVGTFVFASELKAMLASGLIPREISSAGLVGYLMFGSVPNPLTIYRDIQALEPGCTLTITSAGQLARGATGHCHRIKMVTRSRVATTGKLWSMCAPCWRRRYVFGW